ncbi:MAG: hypothetical protein M3R15_15565 [Acidobacteriota bacterium]|nr:hypothetical protein [Acidobacteriota bacterium]
MSQRNIKQPPLTPERERAAAEALADLMRRAEAQGVEPFDFDAAFGEGGEGQSQEEIRQEVDEFLQMVRETRDTSSARSFE